MSLFGSVCGYVCHQVEIQFWPVNVAFYQHCTKLYNIVRTVQHCTKLFNILQNCTALFTMLKFILLSSENYGKRPEGWRSHWLTLHHFFSWAALKNLWNACLHVICIVTDHRWHITSATLGRLHPWWQSQNIELVSCWLFVSLVSLFPSQETGKADQPACVQQAVAAGSRWHQQSAAASPP